MTTLADSFTRRARVSGHYPIGASTGYMEDLRGKWPEQVEAACELSPFAVELSALAEPDLDPLHAFLADSPRLPFRYVSVHGPAKDRRSSEPELVASLARLPAIVETIVMHPDTIDDPKPYEALGSRLAIENMDRRKESGRTADELVRLFESLPEAGFCFDIAHAHSVDASVAVGEQLLDAFAPRLRQVHASSLSEDLSHVPLLRDHEDLFAPLLFRCLDVPWILEAFEQPN